MNDDAKNSIEHHFMAAIISQYQEDQRLRVDITARLGLLVILMYEDGHIDSREIKALCDYCHKQFSFTLEDAQKVIDECIKRLSYGFNIKESLDLFCRYLLTHKNEAERLALILTLQEIAHSDNHFDQKEDNLIKKTKAMLNIE